MQLYDKKEDCYGCGACMNACPKHAIQMRMDMQGFLYPVVNNSVCVDCGLCKRSCQIGSTELLQNDAPLICYGAKNHDSIRSMSSSGGVFTAIMQNWKYASLKRWAIAGAMFDCKMNVVHKMAQTLEECNAFRGSKYVQSNMGTIYGEVADSLSDRRNVLFSGTPCQVAGLKKYLKTHQIDTSGLLTVDLVCHGVPSPKIWMDYIGVLERKYHAKVTNYTFRDKSIGWKGYHARIGLEDGRSIAQNNLIQSFAIIFGKEVMLRPSCFYCPYSSMKRCGDITIGDFSGIEEIDERFSDNKGVSMVLASTQKGQQFFSAIREKLEAREYPAEVLAQLNLRKPTDFSVDYDTFWKDYDSKGYRYVAKKYGGYGLLRKIRHYKSAIRLRLMK